jgi:hypothetical protein
MIEGLVNVDHSLDLQVQWVQWVQWVKPGTQQWFIQISHLLKDSQILECLLSLALAYHKVMANYNHATNSQLLEKETKEETVAMEKKLMKGLKMMTMQVEERDEGETMSRTEWRGNETGSWQG